MESFRFSKDILEITKDMAMFVVQCIPRTGVAQRDASKLKEENRLSARCGAKINLPFVE